jgi:two-component system, NarL family, nitrate/nitrite response regulator NarL
VSPAYSSAQAGPIRVVSADQEPLFRDALGRALRQDAALELVGEAADATTLVAAIVRQRPDVVLVDPGLLAAATGAAARATRLLVLASEPDAADAYAAIAAGAAGYLSKAAEAPLIRRAVAAVARGETVIDREVQSGLAHEIRLHVRNRRPTLTAREREVLVLIMEGHSGPEIARRLQVSPATVKTHLLHLYEKLGVTERAAAVAEAMRQGLVE